MVTPVAPTASVSIEGHRDDQRSGGTRSAGGHTSNAAADYTSIVMCGGIRSKQQQ